MNNQEVEKKVLSLDVKLIRINDPVNEKATVKLKILYSEQKLLFNIFLDQSMTQLISEEKLDFKYFNQREDVYWVELSYPVNSI
jgi:hypothetical protein